jgi:hypothetical protein
MVRLLSVVVLSLSLTAAGHALPTGGATPRVWAVHAGDGFSLADSKIACLVGSNPVGTILCFKQTGSLSFRPAAATYALLEDEGSLRIEHRDGTGHPVVVLKRLQPTASAAPAVARLAAPLTGGVGLLHRGDAVYLVGTHVVCVDSSATPALTCGSLNATGLTRGSYFARLTDRSVAVARVKSSNDFKAVFQASQ